MNVQLIRALTVSSDNISSNPTASLCKANGRIKAKLIQVACGPALDSHCKWSLQLLEEKDQVELETPISREIIRHALKNAVS